MNTDPKLEPALKEEESRSEWDAIREENAELLAAKKQSEALTQEALRASLTYCASVLEIMASANHSAICRDAARAARETLALGGTS